MRVRRIVGAAAALALLAGWQVGVADAQAAPRQIPVPLVNPKKPKPVKPKVVPAGPADYFVKFKAGVANGTGTRATQARGGEVKRKFRKAFHGVLAHLTPAQRDALQSDPSIEYVEPKTEITISSGSESDPPWGIDRVDNRSLPINHNFSWGPNGSGVDVYVIDTGINKAHVDFGGRARYGYNFHQNSVDTSDCNGHGTHVAGTIGGNRSGVAKGVTLIPLRVNVGCTNTIDVGAVFASFDYILEGGGLNHPTVMNMSFGGGLSTALDDAVQYMVNNGVVAVASAGNDADDACYSSPARVPGALTVAATNSADSETAWSNYGPCVDLYAPGDNIVSASNTSNTGWASMKGTSMSAPHVAGAAALIMSVHPAWTPAQVSAEIIGKATTGKVKNANSVNRLLFTGGGSTKAPLWPAPTPTVSGTATMGSTLTGSFGAWGPSPVTLKYQWQRMFGTTVTNIAGATGTSYRLTAADVGARVRATVVGYATDYAPVGRVSAWSNVVTGSITGTVPTITGTAKVGQQLKANAGTWAPSAVTLHYQWYRVSSTGAMSAISGATWSQYGLTASDLNYAIRVSVTGTRPYFANVTKVSAATGKVGLGTLTAATPTISGTTKVSYTVTANPGTWGPAPVTLRYQWYKVSSAGATSAISGATASSYQLLSGLRGYRLRVTVTGSKTGYTTTYRWSGTSAAVA